MQTLPEFSNVPLLAFLATAAAAEADGLGIAQRAGLAGADLSLFRAVAAERGFLDRSGALTPVGRAWAARELEPFAPLFINPAV